MNINSSKRISFWDSVKSPSFKNLRIDFAKTKWDFNSLLRKWSYSQSFIYIDDKTIENRFEFWKQISLDRDLNSYTNLFDYLKDEKLSKNSDLFLKDLLTKYFVEYSKKNLKLIKDSAYKFGYDLKEFEKIVPGIITKDFINNYAVRYSTIFG